VAVDSPPLEDPPAGRAKFVWEVMERISRISFAAGRASEISYAKGRASEISFAKGRVSGISYAKGHDFSRAENVAK
jgi:hypothetical protein